MTEKIVKYFEFWWKMKIIMEQKNRYLTRVFDIKI